MRDRETMEMVLEAAESGHLVLTSMNTVSVAKTVERMVSSFGQCEQVSIRSRLARTFRYIVSQRLIPRKDGRDESPSWKCSRLILAPRRAWKSAIPAGDNLLQAMRDGASEGMQYFDGELEKLVQRRSWSISTPR